ncbi:RidA family protein [Erythrobacter aureus]|uniref:RidA family protein n=1 Tax=Erythrobacter aureus TaxID=2182384 RepID=UPI003A903127
MAGDPRILCSNPADAAPPGGHYSHATAFGDLVFTSGQLPVQATGEHDVAAAFGVQAGRALANLDAALRAAGSSRKSILKLTAYVTDIGDWPHFNTLYAEFMGNHRPARCVVPVPELHFGYAIEIEAVALKDKAG